MLNSSLTLQTIATDTCSLVEEGLKRSQTEDDGVITHWLLATLSQS